MPLVSKRWRDLTHSPALLRQLAIELRKTNALPALLRSLSAGLLRRAAGHVASLRLALDASCTYQTGVATTPGTAVFEEVAPSAGAGAEAEDGLHAVQAGLACCLAACDAPGPRSLSSLVLDLDYLPLCLADPWATGALRNLRQLSVRTFGAPLSVSAPLHTLDRLAELSLDGAPLALGEAARLPAGLTRLHLAGVQDAGVFGKVGALGTGPAPGCFALPRQWQRRLSVRPPRTPSGSRAARGAAPDVRLVRCQLASAPQPARRTCRTGCRWRRPPPCGACR